MILQLSSRRRYSQFLKISRLTKGRMHFLLFGSLPLNDWIFFHPEKHSMLNYIVADTIHYV